MLQAVLNVYSLTGFQKIPSHLYYKIVNELADYPYAPYSPKCITIILDRPIQGNFVQHLARTSQFRYFFSGHNKLGSTLSLNYQVLRSIAIHFAVLIFL